MQIQHPNNHLIGDIPLVSSKSESNRALIIQALGGNGILLDNISEARDTQTMMRLLKSNEQTLDVLDAGTTMRFLTAFATAKNRDTVMTGTARMKERPIGILVDALRSLGAEIDYLENEGYPPMHIKRFEQKTPQVSVRGDVSSQYISALLMIAPCLPQGLELTLEGEVASRPYIEMTIQLMKHFGTQVKWEGALIKVLPQAYQANQYTIESDWSGASYWYSMVALSTKSDIKLLHLREDSLQGDKAIVEIMEMLGVSSSFEKDGVRLVKTPIQSSFDYDFTHCPDLAQTVVVLISALGLEGRLTGLKSLRIKETDRIAALQNELKKFGKELEVIGDEEIRIPVGKLYFDDQILIDTYEDHRMAMAFAPLGLLAKVNIDEPEVVKKSYPSYWEHLNAVGFELND